MGRPANRCGEPVRLGEPCRGSPAAAPAALAAGCCDLFARPLLALIGLILVGGTRNHLALRPAGVNRVIVEAGKGAIVAALELEGELCQMQSGFAAESCAK